MGALFCFCHLMRCISFPFWSVHLSRQCLPPSARLVEKRWSPDLVVRGMPWQLLVSHLGGLVFFFFHPFVLTASDQSAYRTRPTMPPPRKKCMTGPGTAQSSSQFVLNISAPYTSYTSPSTPTPSLTASMMSPAVLFLRLLFFSRLLFMKGHVRIVCVGHVSMPWQWILKTCEY